MASSLISRLDCFKATTCNIGYLYPDVSTFFQLRSCLVSVRQPADGCSLLLQEWVLKTEGQVEACPE